MNSAIQMEAQSAFDQVKKLPQFPKHASMDKLRKTAQDFEAVFIGQMLKPMFEGIRTDGVFGGGQAEKMYRGLMVEEYGKSIAKSGGVGIADAVMREMIKQQEVQ